VDKARQSVFESERLSAGKAASLTVSLRKGALDLYTELALVKSWEVAAPSLGDFREYLSKSEVQELLCEGNFACYCPLCRGKAGVHYIRVFDLACNLYAAVYTVRQATEHNRDLLREPITDYFHKAVRFLRQGAEKLTSISWKATDPLRDLLHQYAARYPDPALNLIDELLYYFQHGRWREPQRKVAATFPLAFQNGGAIAKLALEQTDALVPGFYPHPELLLATRWDRDFAEQFACAWQHHATDKTAALRWSLEPYRSEGRVWDGNPIGGPSVGAAVGVALKCLHAPTSRRPTSTAPSQASWSLTARSAASAATCRRPCPLTATAHSGNSPAAMSFLLNACLPDWGSRLRRAVDMTTRCNRQPTSPPPCNSTCNGLSSNWTPRLGTATGRSSPTSGSSRPCACWYRNRPNATWTPMKTGKPPKTLPSEVARKPPERSLLTCTQNYRLRSTN
jgi:hypothetical protein